jgi:hypothetical protein
MWWKTILKIAVAVGLDKWAKRKAKALVDKLRKKAVKKAEQIEDAVKDKVKKVLASDEDGNQFVVETLDGKVTVRRVKRGN